MAMRVMAGMMWAVCLLTLMPGIHRIGRGEAATEPGTQPSVAASVPSRPAPADLAAPLTMPLGINLEQVCDYAHSMMFVDAMKSARRFGSAETPWDEKAPVDEKGWPTGDAGSCVLTDLPNIAGTYHFSCQGKADLKVSGGSKATIVGWRYDSASNMTSAQIVVPEGQTQLFLSFINTNGGVKDIHLIRPGYPADTTQMFTREFLTQLAPFTTVRLMDYLRTNETNVKTWAERARPTDALQSSGKGACYEYAIALANQAGKDLWINIPDQADDEYIKQLAILLHRSLRPERRVYLEYSNEVWNFSMQQAGRNLAAAKAEVAGGTGGKASLSDEGKDTNEYYWAWKRVAKRLVEISDIFRGVMGSDAVNGRFRPVLASQSANPFILRTQLEFIARHYGAPARKIYGVAGAPYFGIPGDANKRDDLSTDDIFNRHLPEDFKWVRSAMQQFTLQARLYDLKSLCYEGGAGLEGEHSLDAKIAANRDPRMTKAIVDYLTDWYSGGGDLFMYYSLCGTYSKHGCWGLTDDISQQTAKTRAMQQVARMSRPKVKAGVQIPATIEAIKYDDHVGGGTEKAADGREHLAFLRTGANFDYLVTIPNIGFYSITIQAASGGVGSQLRLQLDQRELGLVDVPNTGGGQNFQDCLPVKASLPAGVHVLRLEVVKEGMNVRGIKIEGR